MVVYRCTCIFFWKACRVYNHILYELFKHGVMELNHLLMAVGGGPSKRGRPTTAVDPRCMYSGVCQVGKGAGMWFGKRWALTSLPAMYHISLLCRLC